MRAGKARESGRIKTSWIILFYLNEGGKLYSYEHPFDAFVFRHPCKGIAEKPPPDGIDNGDYISTIQAYSTSSVPRHLISFFFFFFFFLQATRRCC